MKSTQQTRLQLIDAWITSTLWRLLVYYIMYLSDLINSLRILKTRTKRSHSVRWSLEVNGFYCNSVEAHGWRKCSCGWSFNFSPNCQNLGLLRWNELNAQTYLLLPFCMYVVQGSNVSTARPCLIELRKRAIPSCFPSNVSKLKLCCARDASLVHTNECTLSIEHTHANCTSHAHTYRRYSNDCTVIYSSASATELKQNPSPKY